ncbi:MAG: AmmeMemoRadiSam system protein A [Thermoleophilia bacterium]
MRPEESNHDPLVSLARKAVETYVREGRYLNPEEVALSDDAAPPGAGVFVSLHRPDGSLRGCLGTIAATRPRLEEEIVANAVAAATRDPRFPPLSPEELEELHLSVDVLHPPEEVRGLEDLDPERYGIIVRTEDGRQALLLPRLEGVDTAEKQLHLTCRKGGIHPSRDRYRLYRFESVRHE